MNCFTVKGSYEVCPCCGYIEGTPPEQPHYLAPGIILGGHFTVGTVIGSGGFGITYRCFDSSLGMTVAIKEFFPAKLADRTAGESAVSVPSGDRSEKYGRELDRFLTEAQSVARFGKAKDIVNVYDFFEENNTAYIVMEIIEGVLLKDFMRERGRMDPEACHGVIMPIIRAVRKIHSRGIIHNDISPDNIIISDDNTVKVFDFGSATITSQDGTLEGQRVKKAGYSAPEQYLEKAGRGFYTDVYSVGAILYEMLTGVRPVDAVQRLESDGMRSPGELGAGVSLNMDRTVMEALAVDPRLRFQTAAGMENALNNRAAAEYPREKGKRRRIRRILTAALSVLAVVLAGAGITLGVTVLRVTNPVFDDRIHGTKTAVTVWVENEDQKNMIDALAEDGFKKRGGEGSSETEEDEAIAAMQEDDRDVRVSVEVKRDMETALEKEKDSLPDMFITDNVTDPEKYGLISLEKSVYQAIDPKKYMYMDRYEEFFPEFKEMPTGFETLMCYALSFEYNLKNTLGDSSWYRGENSSLDIGELIRSAEAGIRDTGGRIDPSCAFFYGRAKSEGLILNAKGRTGAVKAGEKEMSSLLQAMREYDEYSKKIIFGEGKTGGEDLNILASNIVAGISDRKKLRHIIDSASDKKGANTVTDYRAMLVTAGERPLVRFADCFAIREGAPENSRTACMRLLYVMLTEKGQHIKSGPEEMAFPISTDSFRDFETYNAGMGGVTDLLSPESDALIIKKGDEIRSLSDDHKSK